MTTREPSATPVRMVYLKEKTGPAVWDRSFPSSPYCRVNETAAGVPFQV